MFTTPSCVLRPFSRFLGAMLVLCGAAAPVFAAITVDTTSFQLAGSGSTSMSFNHVLGAGANRLVVCGVAIATPDAAIAPITPDDSDAMPPR